MDNGYERTSSYVRVDKLKMGFYPLNYPLIIANFHGKKVRRKSFPSNLQSPLFTSSYVRTCSKYVLAGR